MRLYFKCLLTSSLGMVLSGAAAAEEARPPQADNSVIIVLGQREQGLDMVAETGSRLNLTALETPASVETLSGDVIRQRGDLSIVDAVTRATGITSVANPGNGNTGLSARGFNGPGSVMQLYDGLRLYPGAGTVTFPVDPWMVDRIEVLRGSASVLYGQGAIGGAVNVISKSPNSSHTVVDAEAGYGSQNSWRIGVGMGGPLNETLSYRVDASRTGSDGWVDRGTSKGLALSGSLRFAPTENFSLTLSDDYSDQEPMRYFGTPLIAGVLRDENRRRNYNVLDSIMHFKDNWLKLRADWTISDGISVTNTAYWLTTDRTWRNLESYFYDSPSAKIFRTDNLGIHHDETQTGDQATLTIKRPIGGLNNDLVIGFDINSIAFKHSNDFGSDTQEDLVNPYTFNPGLFLDTQGVAPRYRTKTRQYSIFAEDRLALSDKFSIIAGLNSDNARVTRFTINPAGAETQVLNTALNNVTWRVGAVFQPSKTTSLYAQYATAVDPLGSLVTLSVSQSTFRNATGNQIEVGAKASFLAGHGNISVAAYRIVKNNLLVRDPKNLTSTTPLQVGQRSAQGLEATLSLDIAGGFGIDVNGTVLDAKFEEFNAGGVSYNGKTPPNIAETTGNLWLLWKANARFQTRLGLRYVGKTFSDNANAFRIPAYVVVDGGVSYAVTNNLALNMRIYNLFDRAYATTTYNDEQWLRGRPRSVDVSISARF